jgi:hypothetical protein
MGMSQSDTFPNDDVPQFSASLEADIRVGLRMRLGREPTHDELGDYRKALWALACAARRIVEAEVERRSARPDRE